MSQQSTCYACEEPGTTWEHAPPRALFPELKDLAQGVDLRKDLIRVRSCNKHNSQCSKDDEYLMWILSLHVQGNRTKQVHFSSKVMRAYQRRPETFFGLLDDITPIQIEDFNGSVHDSAAFKVDLSRFNRCMWRMAIAIYHFETNKKWLGGYRVFSDAFVELVGTDSERQNQVRVDVVGRMYDAFENIQPMGANSEVFNYRLVTLPDRAALMFKFYEGINVIVLLSDV